MHSLSVLRQLAQGFPWSHYDSQIRECHSVDVEAVKAQQEALA